jgi:hypothetical protein
LRRITGLVNLPKPENYLLFIEQLKVSQYKVYNIRNIENMVSYKSGRGCALSVERHPEDMEHKGSAGIQDSVSCRLLDCSVVAAVW